MAKFVNLTQHEIRIRVNRENLNPTPDESDIILAPSGILARVSSKSVQIGELNGIPVVKSVFGDIDNLPPAEEGTIYIGSTPLAQKAALDGRSDVVSPNTAPKQDIRYPDGHPQAGRTFAVTSFQSF